MQEAEQGNNAGAEQGNNAGAEQGNNAGAGQGNNAEAEQANNQEATDTTLTTEINSDFGNQSIEMGSKQSKQV